MAFKPLVSVICLCYNHEEFVEEAILSVVKQTYENIQLIVVDDASTDNSRQVIERVIAESPGIIYLPLKTNHDNCAAFNIGLKAVKGEYVIDLAADDILCPDRVSAGIKAFRACDSSYGVNISNSETIDEAGNFVQYHYPVDDQGHALIQVPEGDVFIDVIQRYFISPPTIMFKKEVIDRLEGYDESLTYEDFDFWVRSSRHYKYVYTDAVLVKKRIVKGSKSQKQFKIWSRDLITTYHVCEKASRLVRNDGENTALKKRIRYEIKQSVRFLSFGLALKYVRLLKKMRKSPQINSD